MHPEALLLKLDLQHELDRKTLSPAPHLLDQNPVFNEIPR